jgi:hypothetical protein
MNVNVDPVYNLFLLPLCNACNLFVIKRRILLFPQHKTLAPCSHAQVCAILYWNIAFGTSKILSQHILLVLE